MDYKKGHGIKVCLKAKKESDLFRLQKVCEERNIPYSIIEDLGYTCFEGQTTITCLGIGPIRKDELPELQKMSLLS
jgi:peptidyl-tRNA hydrolase